MNESLKIEGLADLVIPTLQVDEELAQDYLIRFMEYRVNGYVIPYSMRFDVSSEIFEEAGIGPLMRLVESLAQKGFTLDSKEYIDENILLKLESQDAILFVACCHANDSTIIVSGYTPSEF